MIPPYFRPWWYLYRVVVYRYWSIIYARVDFIKSIVLTWSISTYISHVIFSTIATRSALLWSGILWSGEETCSTWVSRVLWKPAPTSCRDCRVTLSSPGRWGRGRLVERRRRLERELSTLTEDDKTAGMRNDGKNNRRDQGNIMITTICKRVQAGFGNGRQYQPLLLVPRL